MADRITMAHVRRLVAHLRDNSPEWPMDTWAPPAFVVPVYAPCGRLSVLTLSIRAAYGERA